LQEDIETKASISPTTSTQLALMCSNRNLCKLKHAHTCLYYDQVTWLRLSHAIKSFQERHSHTMCVIKNALQHLF